MLHVQKNFETLLTTFLVLECSFVCINKHCAWNGQFIKTENPLSHRYRHIGRMNIEMSRSSLTAFNTILVYKTDHWHRNTFHIFLSLCSSLKSKVCDIFLSIVNRRNRFPISNWILSLCYTPFGIILVSLNPKVLVTKSIYSCHLQKL